MENRPGAKKDSRQTAEQQTHGASSMRSRNPSYHGLIMDGEIGVRLHSCERGAGHHL
jgi:hypothetical protein